MTMMLRAGLVAVVIVVVAASGLRGPSAAVELTPADPAAAPVGITVVDRAGIVRAVSAAPGLTTEGVHAGERPDQVVIAWLVGACHPATTLTVTPSGDGLTIEERTAPCSGLKLGVTRAVTLDLRRAVDPSLVELVAPEGRS